MLAADRLVVATLGHQLGWPGTSPSSATAALAAAACSSSWPRSAPVDVAAGHEGGEEVAALALLAGPVADLRRDVGVLAAGDDAAAGRLLGEGTAVAGEHAGDGGEPGVDVGPGLLALGRHQVEGLAHVVERAGDDAELGAGEARVGELLLQPQPLEERVAGHRLALVDRLGRPGRREGLAVELLAGREPVGREVGQLVVVAGDPGVRRHDRVEGGVLLDEALADGVDCSFAGHRASLRSALEPPPTTFRAEPASARHPAGPPAVLAVGVAHPHRAVRRGPLRARPAAPRAEPPTPREENTATSAATSSAVASGVTTRSTGRSSPARSSLTAGCSRASWRAASPAWCAAAAAPGPPRRGSRGAG